MKVGIGKVEPGAFYIDVAFRKATKLGSQVKSSVKGAHIYRVRQVELKKLEVASDSLRDSFTSIVVAFPSVDQLSEFYVGLLDSTIGIAPFRKALSTVNWASRKVTELRKIYWKKIKECHEPHEVGGIKKQFYGRLGSVGKQITPDLAFLERARRALLDFPVVRPKMFTVAISGFPNVGKTTLIYKLTGSKPEIANYAFTTKSINVGYVGKGREVIQFLDTPGTLNRFNKMNTVEKQAWLALKYCATIIVYVFDLTEPYPLEEQKKLFEEIKRFDKPLIIYLSKTDILDKNVVDAFCKEFECITDSDVLKARVDEMSKKRDV